MRRPWFGDNDKNHEIENIESQLGLMKERREIYLICITGNAQNLFITIRFFFDWHFNFYVDIDLSSAENKDVARSLLFRNQLQFKVDTNPQKGQKYLLESGFRGCLNRK